MTNEEFRAGYFDVYGESAVKGNTHYWDTEAESYLSDYGEFLGEVQFRWCPEGLTEAEAGLLGPLERLRTQEVLEVGAGAAQCSRWLVANGVHAQATDLAPGMVGAGQRLNQATGVHVPTQVADARELPFVAESFDQVFTAFGAIPFVKRATEVHQEVFRVLRPGGIWTFATTHPFRWAFPDDPNSFTVNRSYFDRTPYAEQSNGHTYAEFHRTVGDHVQEVTAAGFTLKAMIEPSWSEGNTHQWGGWGPTRGEYLPGTLIIQAQKG